MYWLEVYCYELLDRTRARKKTFEGSTPWEVEFDRLLVAIEECCELGEFKISKFFSLPSFSNIQLFVFQLKL